jgi:hypothetical protein
LILRIQKVEFNFLNYAETNLQTANPKKRNTMTTPLTLAQNDNTVLVLDDCDLPMSDAIRGHVDHHGLKVDVRTEDWRKLMQRLSSTCAGEQTLGRLRYIHAPA